MITPFGTYCLEETLIVVSDMHGKYSNEKEFAGLNVCFRHQALELWPASCL